LQRFRNEIGKAAQPGYFVIYAAPPVKADGDWQTFRRPVVGWLSIEDPNDRYVFESLPIVASVNGADTEIWAILAPDGTVYKPYGCEYEKRCRLVGQPEDTGESGVFSQLSFREQKTSAALGDLTKEPGGDARRLPKAGHDATHPRKYLPACPEAPSGEPLKPTV
jgi:hypothetical protein